MKSYLRAIFFGSVHLTSCNILCPLMTVEVLEYPGPFHKLICTKQEKHYFYRKLKDKG